MDNATRQTTTNKQVEILFKFTVFLFSADVAFFRRTSLEILNSLKLRYTRRGNTAVLKTIAACVLDIMTSFIEMTCKAVGKMSNIARRVSSLRLFTVCDEKSGDTPPDIV